ncbi:hypothetical protein G6O67_005291 [Ophiocordyceps sinensis]|uniref:Fe2OG dioxygenase domain-containing protein n=1 Tax=Ophiocordyceps sinensis TaxID=72228 RepID=A0A8H4PR54_9HYPO|nr:hypothetical protein G6O67_005291 [Ophiocordyceps sinensis]
MELRLASGNGPVIRTVLRSPVRDAKPSEIPVIDLSRLFSDTLADREAVASQIHDAASNMGFFYVKNHGIPLQEIRGAYEATLDFFRQDPAQKIKADATEGPFDSGWRGPRTHVLYEARLDPTVEDAASIPHEAAQSIGQGKPAFKGTEQVPQLKESLERYYISCLVLARALTRAFALSPGLSEYAFDSKVRYPDASLEDDVGGLQVLNHEGQWIAAQPIEGTLVVNIGDYMQRITNDRHVSTVHRAKNWSGRERVSMPFFWGFGLHESCEVLESCLGEGGTSKYEEIRYLNSRNLVTGLPPFNSKEFQPQFPHLHFLFSAHQARPAGPLF